VNTLDAWFIEPFVSSQGMQNALWAGLLAVVATSVVGTWVVLRGMSFLGDALAHGVLPGIAIALVLGGNTTVGALVAALFMVGGINVIGARSPLPEDTSIGILFVGFLALARVITSVWPVGGLDPLLFGSISGIDGADIRRQAVAAALSIVAVVVFYRPLLVMTFDETQARLLGLHPRLANTVLLSLLAVTIVTSFEAVGSLLVFAFLVAPAATATLMVNRVPLIMAVAVALGSVAVVIGLLIGWHYETAPSATMALVAVTIFLMALVVHSAVQALTPLRAKAAA